MALSTLVLIGITSTAGSTTATFTATTTNPGHTCPTATLTISNDKPNAGDLINITNLVPGFTQNDAIATASTCAWTSGNTVLTITVQGIDAADTASVAGSQTATYAERRYPEHLRGVDRRDHPAYGHRDPPLIHFPG